MLTLADTRLDYSRIDHQDGANLRMSCQGIYDEREDLSVKF